MTRRKWAAKPMLHRIKGNQNKKNLTIAYILTIAKGRLQGSSILFPKVRPDGLARVPTPVFFPFYNDHIRQFARRQLAIKETP
jgi:hypothetical protein